MTFILNFVNVSYFELSTAAESVWMQTPLSLLPFILFVTPYLLKQSLKPFNGIQGVHLNNERYLNYYKK